VAMALLQRTLNCLSNVCLPVICGDDDTYG